MSEKFGIYRCEKCGNIVEVLHSEKPPISCCNQSMTQLTENTVDAALEKHLPVIEKVEGGYKVKVGSVAHPMEEKHWIEWIELNGQGVIYRHFLNPGDIPEATFMLNAENVTARAYCNLHGFWKS